MENNLKNRYIYAVVRHLPIKMQEDVRQELDSLISEMADAQRDIKDVIAELGSPEELALKYYGSERKALISGVYFLMYKRVLAIVLPIAAIVISVLASLGLVVGGDNSLNIIIFGVPVVGHSVQVILQVIAVTLGGMIQAFAVITIVFAVLDYMNVRLNNDGIDDLPEIPDAKTKIEPFWPIFGIAWSIGLAVLFLGFPEVIRANFNFEWVAVFDVQVIRGLWFPILLWTVIEIGLEIFKLVEGRYTMRLAVVTVAASVVMAICAVAVFGNARELISPEFITAIQRFVADFGFDGEIDGRVFFSPLAVILVVMIFEAAEVVYYVFKAKK